MLMTVIISQDVIGEEISDNIYQMKLEKAPGRNGIVLELTIYGIQELQKALKDSGLYCPKCSNLWKNYDYLSIRLGKLWLTGS